MNPFATLNSSNSKFEDIYPESLSSSVYLPCETFENQSSYESVKKLTLKQLDQENLLSFSSLESFINIEVLELQITDLRSEHTKYIALIPSTSFKKLLIVANKVE